MGVAGGDFGQGFGIPGVYCGLSGFTTQLRDAPGPAPRGLRGFAPGEPAQGLQRLRHVRSRPAVQGLVFAIIRNTHIDRQRRRKTSSLEDPLIDTQTAGLLQSPLFAIPLAPEDILLRQETIERVREGIRRLPTLMREVVELRDIEGLSYRTISTIIDRPIGTVMSRLYRGRNLLRTYLVDPRRQDGHATRGTP